MTDKKILLAAAAMALFGVAGAAGYWGPYWMRKTGQERHADASYVPVSIPEKIVRDFSKEFAVMRAEPGGLTLPDDEFMAPDGQNVRLSDFKGRPLLVNFWATWCAPCVIELPTLNRFAEQYGDRLHVIGVALEAGKTQKDVSDFLKNRKVGDFAAFADETGTLAAKLGLRGIPTSFLIGSDGVILYRFEGDADWASPSSKAFFDAFLGNSTRKSGE